MDNFCEQLVQKTWEKSDKAKVVLIIVGSVALAAAVVFLAVYFNMTVLSLFSLGALALGIWLINGLNVEYEYILTNEEMDIDKVIGRRKRKRLITVDVKKTTDFAAYPSGEDVDSDVTVHATSGLETDAHYLLVDHRDYGTVKIIFNPNKKMREAIAQELPKAVCAKYTDNE